MEEAREWRVGIYSVGQEIQVNPEVDTTIRTLRDTISGRDYVFFVDNSRSMAPYRQEVEEVLRNLAHIAKGDKAKGRAKIEIALGSTVDATIELAKKTSDVVKVVEDCPFVQLESLMEHKFGHLVNAIIRDRLPTNLAQDGNKRDRSPMRKNKDISIIVLTDGCWGIMIPRVLWVSTIRFTSSTRRSDGGTCTEHK